ncbi:MAG: hypothetical protein N2376_05150, partial [Clostridia bacterium]|nr:hypothetical protein [Clostridia bacterium]
LKNNTLIVDKAQFLLGAIAPDSVHFREGFQSDMKKVSHLCNLEQKWGSVTDNEYWTQIVLNFLREHQNSMHRDFILGFCAHILSDIRNNIKIWIPFKEKQTQPTNNIHGSLLHQEAAEIDYKLYRTYEQTPVIWELLEQSHGIDLCGLVFSSEIDKMKQALLYEQYQNKAPGDLSSNQYLTWDTITSFIKEESETVKALLFKNNVYSSNQKC